MKHLRQSGGRHSCHDTEHNLDMSQPKFLQLAASLGESASPKMSGTGMLIQLMTFATPWSSSS